MGRAHHSGRRKRRHRGAGDRPRRHRAPGGRGRAQGGAHPGGGRQSRQVTLSRRHEPRDPHADERHPRHGGAARRYEPDGGAAHLHVGRRALGAHAAHTDRRDPRLLQDRGRQAEPACGALRARRVRPERRRTAVATRPGEGHPARLGHRSGPAARDRRRRGAAAPDHYQPRRQRHQVHGQGRRAGDRLAQCGRRPEGRQGTRHRDRGRGHRHRHQQGAARAALQ